MTAMHRFIITLSILSLALAVPGASAQEAKGQITGLLLDDRIQLDVGSSDGVAIGLRARVFYLDPEFNARVYIAVIRIVEVSAHSSIAVIEKSNDKVVLGQSVEWNEWLRQPRPDSLATGSAASRTVNERLPGEAESELAPAEEEQSFFQAASAIGIRKLSDFIKKYPNSSYRHRAERLIYFRLNQHGMMEMRRMLGRIRIAKYSFDGLTLRQSEMHLTADGGHGPESSTVHNVAIIPSDFGARKDKEGIAVRFNGTDSFIHLEKHPITSGDFTITLWARRLGQGGGSNWVTLVRANAPGTKGGYNIYWYDNGIIEARVNSDSSNAVLQYDDAPDNIWIHIALVYDGEYSRLYIAGKLVAEAKMFGNLNAPNFPLSLGGQGFGRDAAYFNGDMDEVTFIPLALSAQHVEYMYYQEAK